jgi:hypothetical protein
MPSAFPFTAQSVLLSPQRLDRSTATLRMHLRARACPCEAAALISGCACAVAADVQYECSRLLCRPDPVTRRGTALQPCNLIILQCDRFTLQRSAARDRFTLQRSAAQRPFYIATQCCTATRSTRYTRTTVAMLTGLNRPTTVRSWRLPPYAELIIGTLPTARRLHLKP